MLAHQQYTPLLYESIVRLGSALPFAQAAEALGHFRQVAVSASTVRRLTEQMGALQVAYQAQEPVVCEEAAPRIQVLEADGAFVRVESGDWREVKTLVVGVANEAVRGDKRGVHTTQLSYFSRLAEVEFFRQAAQVELRRRGVGQTVCAVSDGAVWLQGCWDVWCPSAVRILDCVHALHYVAQAGQAVFGLDTSAFAAWFAQQRRTLLTGRATQVIDALQQLSLAADDRQLGEGVQHTIDESWHYLHSRRSMIQYAAFQALGYPIGSGAVESANKLLVERRLKGAGMQWCAANVNPLLALTNLAANRRWHPTWPKLITFRTQQAWHARLEQRARKHPPPPIPDPEPLAPDPEPAPPKPPYKPASDHPWRRLVDRACPTRAIA